MSLSSPRGTSDLYGKDINYRDFIIEKARELFEVFNYKEIITPVFEHTELFDRGIGQGTEIVQKEMYTFKDKKGRSLTLRPEGTASVVRAVIENKLYSENLPLKLFYIENMFRYERPQKGRSREFWQIGVEVFGEKEPLLDVEAIWLLNSFYENIGFKNLKLMINSIGCNSCRPLFIKRFKSYLSPRFDDLCQDCKFRYGKSPLRIFDCKNLSCRELLKGAPKIGENLCKECRDYFDSVKDYLLALDIGFKVDPFMVRGFDYYSRTIFEIVSLDIKSAQNALAGGGRYDYLVKDFGGPDISAVGFAVGLDRTILQMKKLNITPGKESGGKSLSIITMDRKFLGFSISILRFLRENNIVSDLEYDGKNIGTLIKKAKKQGFDFVIIIGEKEFENKSVTIKDLKAFKQYDIDFEKDKNQILDLIGEDNG